MPVKQKQNIKGFSLIELLVIIAIIAIVSAIGFPNFSKWSTDRKLRAQSEKIASLFTTATTQVERGAYPYIKVEFVAGSSPGEITVKGISQDLFSKKINGPIDPTCSVADFTTSTGYEVDTLASHTLDEKTYIPVLAPKAGGTSTGSGGAICFSKGGKYFKQHGSADIQGNIILETQPTNNFVAVCHLKSLNCDPVDNKFDNNYPTYLVRYSRFGLITKYKWKRDELNPPGDWSSQ